MPHLKLLVGTMIQNSRENKLSFSDEDPQLDALIRQHGGTLAKGPITGAMIGFSLYVAGHQLWSAALLGAICCCLTVFRTWRRILEIIAILSFIAAAFSLSDLAALLIFKH
jgi:hypothetical protein